MSGQRAPFIRSSGRLSEETHEVFDRDTCLPKDRSERAAIELPMIGNNDLRERIGTPKNDMTRLLTPHEKSGAREGIDAFTTRHARKLRQTAITIVSNGSGGTGIWSSSSAATYS